jgi:hypothetical protein
MAGATLEPAGSGVAGVQPKGITQQYQVVGTSSASSGLSGVTPRDSGSIVINTKPGQSPEKQTDGTVQRSTQLLCSAAPGVVGNALVSTYGGGPIPIPPTGSHAADGLSQAPQHE